MNDTMMDGGDPCGADIAGTYDQGLHVGGLFIIMGCSLCGTVLPVAMQRFPVLKTYKLIFNIGKLFGVGVILATSLVHMLIPAAANLSNPCLPQVFSEDYPAFAGAFCLLALLMLHFVQLQVYQHMRRRVENTEPVTDMKDSEKGEQTEDDDEHGHSHGHDLVLRKEVHASTYILELGIASHSVIIGVALGVSREPEFHTLLIALVFHQFFEGIALSSVVLDSKFDKNWNSIFVVIFYTLTTPLGIAIGIGINASFNANGVDTLIATGILDAVSAGILLYDALVNILPHHFKSKQFLNASTGSQYTQLGAFWLGTVVMALIGTWA